MKSTEIFALFVWKNIETNPADLAIEEGRIQVD